MPSKRRLKPATPRPQSDSTVTITWIDGAPVVHMLGIACSGITMLPGNG